MGVWIQVRGKKQNAHMTVLDGGTDMNTRMEGGLRVVARQGGRGDGCRATQRELQRQAGKLLKTPPLGKGMKPTEREL